MNTNEMITLYLQNLFLQELSSADGITKEEVITDIWSFWNSIHTLARGERVLPKEYDIDTLRKSFLLDELTGMSCVSTVVKKLITNYGLFLTKLEIPENSDSVEFWLWIYSENTKVFPNKKRVSPDSESYIEKKAYANTSNSSELKDPNSLIKRKIRRVIGGQIKSRDEWKKLLNSDVSTRVSTLLKNLLVQETIVLSYLFTRINDRETFKNLAILDYSPESIQKILSCTIAPNKRELCELIRYFLIDTKNSLSSDLASFYQHNKPLFDKQEEGIDLVDHLNKNHTSFKSMPPEDLDTELIHKLIDLFEEDKTEKKNQSKIEDEMIDIKEKNDKSKKSIIQLKNQFKVDYTDDLLNLINFIEEECGDFKFRFRLMFSLVYLSNKLMVTFSHKENERQKAYDSLTSVFEYEDDLHTKSALKDIMNLNSKKYIWGESTYINLNKNIINLYLKKLDEVMQLFGEIDDEIDDIDANRIIRQLQRIYFSKRQDLTDDQFIGLIYDTKSYFIMKIKIIGQYFDLKIHYVKDELNYREADQIKSHHLLLVKVIKQLKCVTQTMLKLVQTEANKNLKTELESVQDKVFKIFQYHSEEEEIVINTITDWLTEIENHQLNEQTIYTDKRNYLRKFFTTFWKPNRGKNAENLEGSEKWLEQVDLLLKRRRLIMPESDDPYSNIVKRIKTAYPESSEEPFQIGSQDNNIDLAAFFIKRCDSQKYMRLLEIHEKVLQEQNPLSNKEG